ncbi:MAG: hypothetical protein IT243_00905 [Bacteroidia bacterium]|nr:hypothetical protein [Bacteroidia bacterium]
MEAIIFPYIRLIHIIFGTIWVGSNLFMALFLYPAVKLSGNIGNQFLPYLPKTNNMPMTMTISGFIAIVTGIWIIYYMSGGSFDYLSSSLGKCILIGGILGLIAFVNGVFYIRPKGLKIDKIAYNISKSDNPPTQQDINEITRLSNAIVKATNFEAIVLALCLIFMGIARYI